MTLEKTWETQKVYWRGRKDSCHQEISHLIFGVFFYTAFIINNCEPFRLLWCCNWRKVKKVEREKQMAIVSKFSDFHWWGTFGSLVFSASLFRVCGEWRGNLPLPDEAPLEFYSEKSCSFSLVYRPPTMWWASL